MGAGGTVREAVIGRVVRLPPAVVARWPELAEARWRVGGIPPRIAGWLLGRRCVAAVTLWRTIWIARDVPLSAELLLHELRHVHQFQSSVTFPLHYIWETLRRGYHRNRYEADARAWASARLRAGATDPRRGDV